MKQKTKLPDRYPVHGEEYHKLLVFVAVVRETCYVALQRIDEFSTGWI